MLRHETAGGYIDKSHNCNKKIQCWRMNLESCPCEWALYQWAITPVCKCMCACGICSYVHQVCEIILVHMKAGGGYSMSCLLYPSILFHWDKVSPASSKILHVSVPSTTSLGLQAYVCLCPFFVCFNSEVWTQTQILMFAQQALYSPSPLPIPFRFLTQI